MNDTPLICITSTWNTDELMQPFISHMLEIGVDLIVVSEYGSTDRTREILFDSRWQRHIKVFDIELKDSAYCTNHRLEWVKKEYPEAWCILCDPDEFLRTNGDDLKNKLSEFYRDGVSGLSIPRYNMTARLSSVISRDLEKNFMRALRYRINDSRSRKPEEYLQDTLTPPWIFTKILNKVIFYVGHIDHVSDGDHCVSGPAHDSSSLVRQHNLFMDHYPMRSWSQFENKILMAKKDFEAGSFPQGSGWHWRRWIKLMENGQLYQEYLDQFIPDELIPVLLATNVLFDRNTNS